MRQLHRAEGLPAGNVSGGSHCLPRHAAAVLLFFIHKYSPGRYEFDKLRKADYWLFLKLAFVGPAVESGAIHQRLEIYDRCAFRSGGTFGPLFTLLFAWKRGQEKLTPMKLFGMALSMSRNFLPEP